MLAEFLKIRSTFNVFKGNTVTLNVLFLRKVLFFFAMPYTVAKNVLEHSHKLEGSELKLQRFIPEEPPEVNEGRVIDYQFSFFLWNYSLDGF